MFQLIKLRFLSKIGMINSIDNDYIEQLIANIDGKKFTYDIHYDHSKQSQNYSPPSIPSMDDTRASYID